MSAAGGSESDPLGLRIVPATPSDVDMVIDLLEEGARWLQAMGIEQWPVGVFSALHDLLTKHVAVGEVFLGVQADFVVATIRLQWSDHEMWPEDEGEAGYVHGLAVRRAWAGRGIGRRMLRWAEATVKQEGKRYLRLDCVAHNERLVRYYLEAGFEPRGQVESHWGEHATLHRRFEKRVADGL